MTDEPRSGTGQDCARKRPRPTKWVENRRGQTPEECETGDMSQDNESSAPLGHYDAGDPLYIVQDKDGRHLSYHKTAEGAEAIRKSYGDTATIQQAELHR